MREVWPYLIAGLALTILLAFAAHPAVAVAAGALTLGVASFFRDPHRDVRADPAAILSPADGRVVSIGPAASGQPPGMRCVSIFLSVFNVHVNRSPVAGRISGIEYTPGSFLPAYREKASELNEQNLIALETDRGPMAVKQIAGLIARRIRCWKRPGDAVSQGEKIGFITFGSRVDLFIPPGAELRVRVGDRVRGGLTVMAAYKGAGGSEQAGATP
ncbi:MAG TPA: phosphatidylserine decarboxylase [Candidatus Polarisedimenticolia bacterium]|nr:phosphatidylserine decarboxylase [Candidatus Polarisedimenticolia bacterium]